MNKTTTFPSFTGLLLARTGGWYPILVVALAQLATSPLGILLAAIPSRTNADLSTEQTLGTAVVAGVALLIRNFILLVGVYLSNRDACRRLSNWRRDIPLEPGTREEERAWGQITSLSWRYIVVAYALLILMALLPSVAYMYFVLGASIDQVVYVSLAGIAAGLGLAVLEILIIDNLLNPAREVLLPHKFETQVLGVKGLRLLPKFQVVVFGLIVVGVLLVAPVGYHQTVAALSGEADPTQVLATLRSQLIIASVGALVLGLVLTYLMARSLSTPIRQMVKVFDRVEEGDLTQRIREIPTDEVGELIMYFNRMIARLETLQTSLEEQVRSRTEQLKTTLEVGNVASSILDPDELIARIVNLITDRFDYYYAAIFLVDSTGRWAELKDATGAGGLTLKEQGHKLEIGGKSMVSAAITNRRAVIALDVGEEPTRFENPLLPETRSEIALPLIVGERVIGVLDVQATQEAAFGEEDIDTLQSMVNQVGIALENARLFQETQKSLDELRTTHRMYLAEAWSDTAREHGAYEYDSGRGQPATGDESSEIGVPLTLRDQIIGELRLEGQEEWTPEERSLIEAVATQAALALENARLLEESRQMALRERLAAEITGKVWSSPNIEFILQTAVRELGRALRADEATIELKLD